MKIIIYLKILLTYITDVEIFFRTRELIQKVLTSMDTVKQWYTETFEEDLKLKLWLFRVPQYELSYLIRPANHTEFFNAMVQLVAHNFNIHNIIT